MLYDRLEKLFAITFVFMRTIPCMFIIYNSWGSKMPGLCSFMGSVLYAVGINWVFIILWKVTKKIEEAGRFPIFVAVMKFLRYNSMIKDALIVAWCIVLPWYLT